MNFTFGSACFEVFIIAFLNNMLEVRIDLYKYSQYNKRGYCTRKGGIGFWFGVMIGILLLSIVSNFGTQVIELFLFANAYNDEYNLINYAIFSKAGLDELHENKVFKLYGYEVFSLENVFLIFIIIQNIGIL